MKRIISLLLALAITIGCFSGTIISVNAITDYTTGVTEDGIGYSIDNETDELTVTYADFSTTDLVIPAYIDGHPVTAIGDNLLNDTPNPILKSVVIPNTVKRIGFGTFGNCINLESVVMSENIEYVEDYAFQNTALTNNTDEWEDGSLYLGKYLYGVSPGYSGEFVVKDGTRVIGNYCFGGINRYGCEKITRISIPNTVIQIGLFAFYNCKGLTSIDIPESVKYIGNAAFGNCTNLSTININTSKLTYVGENIVSNTAYYYDEINWQDDVLYLGTAALCGKNTISDLKIKEGTEIVADYAFACNNGIISVSLPSSLRIICQLAFDDLHSLSAVELPDGLEYIANNAFDGCDLLTELDIPYSVKYIGLFAFNRTDNLEKLTIRNSRCTIIDNHEAYAGGAYSISPNTTVYGYAGSTAETFANNNGVTFVSLGQSEYTGTCGENLTYTLDVESGVVSIQGTGNMSDYYMREYTDNGFVISDSPFSNNAIVKKVIIGDGVTSIGSEAFCTCPNLTEINISDSVTKIGRSAFENSGVKEVVLPDSITEIESSAFRGCANLTHIVLPDGITTISAGMLRDSPLLNNVIISDSITKIESTAFSGCKGLQNIYILNNVSSVDSYAFRNCSNLTVYGYSDSYIEQYAKNNEIDFVSISSKSDICSRVGSHTIKYDPAHEPTCTENGLTEGTHCKICGEAIEPQISIPALGHQYTSEIIQPSRTVEGAIVKTCSVCGYVETEAIPKLSYDEPLISGKCGDDAYYVFDQETGTLTIRGTGTINKREFGSDKFIKKVIIEEGITSIGSRIFPGCVNMTSVEIPEGVTSIGEAAFEYCKSLSSIDLPESLNYISSLAFCECYSLQTIFIPKNVKSHIAMDAFDSCTSLREIDVDPDNPYYHSIDGVLYEKGVLYRYPPAKRESSFTIPDDVTQISGHAFYDCDNLTELTLSEGLTSIATPILGASIKYVYYPGTKSEYDLIKGGNVFSDNANIYVHYNSAGHVWDEGTVKNAATCTEDGEMIYRCTYCDKILTEVVPASGHSLVADKAKAPTCTKTGLTEGSHCSVCGKVLVAQEIISATGHTYSKIVTPPTCTEKGYTTYICDDCGDTYIDNYVNANGHTPSAPVKENENYSCTESGSYDEVVFCSFCGGELSRVHKTSEPLGHHLIFVKQVNATYYRNGRYAHYECDRCGKLFADVTGAHEITEDILLIPMLVEETWTPVPTEPEIIPTEAPTEPEPVVSTYGDYTYKLYSDRHIEITKYKGKDKTISIPSEINGNPVTVIGEKAFYGNTALTEVTIPNSVKSIGSNAFSHCTALDTVNLPDSIKYLSSGLFSYCSSLKNIDIPSSVTSIGYSAFYHCFSLTDVTIPDSVTSIGSNAFDWCGSLTQVTIPQTVKSIGTKAFGYLCDKKMDGFIIKGYENSTAYKYAKNNGFGFESTGYIFVPPTEPKPTSPYPEPTEPPTEPEPTEAPIGQIGNYQYDLNTYDKTATLQKYSGKETNVSIPSQQYFNYYYYYDSGNYKVTAIGNAAFAGNSYVKNVTIPNTVTSIGDDAFYWCDSLSSVTIPDSVTSIGGWAFARCEDLKSVTIPSSVTSIGNKAFGYIDADTRVDGFTITGRTGSAAYKYAVNNGFNFVANDSNILGDVNSDYEVNVMDATFIQAYLSYQHSLNGGDYEPVEKGSRDFTVADVDGDNRISIYDALRIQRYVAGMCKLDGSPAEF